LTALSTVLLETVIVPQLLKIFPIFLENGEFVTFSKGQRLVPLLGQMNTDYTIILFLSDPV
jgi:hypothetical protein